MTTTPGAEDGVRVVILTGLSGAGKTRALQSLEDLGFFCIDNLPPELVPRVVEFIGSSPAKRVGLVMDCRSERLAGSLLKALDDLDQSGIRYDIIFLEASEQAITRRYQESRRRHPLSPEGSVVDGIREEQRRLGDLRRRAALILDTSDLSPHELKVRLSEFLLSNVPALVIRFISFGFKFGSVQDADFVFDVRFLPNPHYVEKLRSKTGSDGEVAAHIFSTATALAFFADLERLMQRVADLVMAEGRDHLTVAIGCTGGRHRSVAIVERLASRMERPGRRIAVEHRDIAREPSP